jgi:putative membrane protein
VKSLTHFFFTYRNTLLIAVLILFYTVGTLGIQMEETRFYFLSLSSFNLVLSFVVSVVAFPVFRARNVLFFLCCYLLSMVAEWIGTSTGYLFGEYYYGKNLGATVVGVPWVIGINWWILLLGASSITTYLKMPAHLAIPTGAMLMTALDILMEPIAIESDFWHWKHNQIPFYNYVCWFILSLILLTIQQLLNKPETNKVHAVLFLIISLFFTVQLIF